MTFVPCFFLCVSHPNLFYWHAWPQPFFPEDTAICLPSSSLSREPGSSSSWAPVICDLCVIFFLPPVSPWPTLKHSSSVPQARILIFHPKQTNTHASCVGRTTPFVLRPHPTALFFWKISSGESWADSFWRALLNLW